MGSTVGLINGTLRVGSVCALRLGPVVQVFVGVDLAFGWSKVKQSQFNGGSPRCVFESLAQRFDGHVSTGIIHRAMRQIVSVLAIGCRDGMHCEVECGRSGGPVQVPSRMSAELMPGYIAEVGLAVC